MREGDTGRDMQFHVGDAGAGRLVRGALLCRIADRRVDTDHIDDFSAGNEFCQTRRPIRIGGDRVTFHR